MAPERRAPRRAAPRGARRVQVALAACAALLACTVARADYMYMCVDKAGKTHTSSQPPPECKSVEIRVLNVDGTVHEIIPAPLTTEQRRERDIERQKELQQEEAQRAQARRDRALLETYGSVAEIEEARKRSLAGRQMLIDRANDRIAQYQRERKRLDDEAEFYVNREMPLKLKEAFEANTVLVHQQEKTRADALAEMKNINERFDADRARYEELEAMAARAAADRARQAAEAPPAD